MHTRNHLHILYHIVYYTYPHIPAYTHTILWVFFYHLWYIKMGHRFHSKLCQRYPEGKHGDCRSLNPMTPDFEKQKSGDPEKQPTRDPLNSPASQPRGRLSEAAGSFESSKPEPRGPRFASRWPRWLVLGFHPSDFIFSHGIDGP